eukprot:5570118-Pyramimonas_sp.AAC.1
MRSNTSVGGPVLTVADQRVQLGVQPIDRLAMCVSCPPCRPKNWLPVHLRTLASGTLRTELHAHD